MIIFPGKSYETISNLVKHFERKSQEENIKKDKLNQKILSASQENEFELCKLYKYTKSRI